MGSNDNIVTIKDVVTHENLFFNPHLLEKHFVAQTKNLESKQR